LPRRPAHGGSGLSDELVRRAIVDGIYNVTIDQELRTRWFQSVRTMVGELAPRAELLELQRRVTGDLQEVVTRKLDGLERRGREPLSANVTRDLRRGQQRVFSHKRKLTASVWVSRARGRGAGAQGVSTS
jgi:hypothetical protein